MKHIFLKRKLNIIIILIIIVAAFVVHIDKNNLNGTWTFDHISREQSFFLPLSESNSGINIFDSDSCTIKFSMNGTLTVCDSDGNSVGSGHYKVIGNILDINGGNMYSTYRCKFEIKNGLLIISEPEEYSSPAQMVLRK